jgi:hypothetical protein
LIAADWSRRLRVWVQVRVRTVPIKVIAARVILVRKKG